MRTDNEHVVIIETLGDIKKAIQEFLPGHKEENPVVEAEFRDDQGRKISVSAPTGCTYREMLIEGFNIVKTRIEIMEKCKEKAEGSGIQPIQIDGHMWLDDLITRRLGGKRDGLRIRWDLQEGSYFFDPFTGKLTKGCSDSSQI